MKGSCVLLTLRLAKIVAPRKLRLRRRCPKAHKAGLEKTTGTSPHPPTPASRFSLPLLHASLRRAEIRNGYTMRRELALFATIIASEFSKNSTSLYTIHLNKYSDSQPS